MKEAEMRYLIAALMVGILLAGCGPSQEYIGQTIPVSTDTGMTGTLYVTRITGSITAYELNGEFSIDGPPGCELSTDTTQTSEGTWLTAWNCPGGAVIQSLGYVDAEIDLKSGYFCCIVESVKQRK
jgi:hypothetical protein